MLRGTIKGGVLAFNIASPSHSRTFCGQSFKETSRRVPNLPYVADLAMFLVSAMGFEPMTY